MNEMGALPRRYGDCPRLRRDPTGTSLPGGGLPSPYACPVSRLVASFFGSGLVLRHVVGGDAGSGTVASLLAFPVAMLIGEIGVWAQVAATLVLVAASLVSTRPFTADEGDPGWVVIDEAAGTFLATIGLAVGPAAIAVIVFRIADVFKRAFPGVARAERTLPGSVGVTADDLVAGLYGLAAGWIVQLAV